MMSNKSQVKRVPKRGHYDKETIYGILDSNLICHVAFIHNNIPVSIPTIFARHNNLLYLHGASVSRMLVELEKGQDMCLSVASVEGLVLARSVFHHSMNYHSAVVFGKGKSVTDDNEKLAALEIITEKLVNGRWKDARLPNATEMKATKVIAIEIEDASAKIRTGPPVDEKEDYELDVWAGVIPVSTKLENAIDDPLLKKDIKTPSYITDKINKQK